MAITDIELTNRFAYVHVIDAPDGDSAVEFVESVLGERASHADSEPFGFVVTVERRLAS